MAPLILNRVGLAAAVVAAEHRLSNSKCLQLHQALLRFLALTAQTVRGCSFVEHRLSADCMRRVVMALIQRRHQRGQCAQLLCNLLLIPQVSQAVVAGDWESCLFSAGEGPGCPIASAPDDDLWDGSQNNARPPTYRPDSKTVHKLKSLLHRCIWSPHFTSDISAGGHALLDQLQDIVHKLTQVKGLAETVTGQSACCNCVPSARATAI